VIATDESMKGEFAGFASRFVAFGIDLALVFSSAGIINWVIITAMGLFSFDLLAPVDTESGVFSRLIMVVGKIVLLSMPFVLLFAYWLVFWTATGQTIGKRVMGVRVVRMDGQRMKVSNSLRRIVMYAVSMVPLFLGFLWILIDDERRGWHDKVAKTCVIYAWNAREVEGFMTGTERRVSRVEERYVPTLESETAQELLEAAQENVQSIDSAETQPLQSSEA
jgi:uncharacterized RDD family membrane protein YckC